MDPRRMREHEKEEGWHHVARSTRSGRKLEDRGDEEIEAPPARRESNLGRIPETRHGASVKRERSGATGRPRKKSKQFHAARALSREKDASMPPELACLSPDEYRAAQMMQKMSDDKGNNEYESIEETTLKSGGTFPHEVPWKLPTEMTPPDAGKSSTDVVHKRTKRAHYDREVKMQGHEEKLVLKSGASSPHEVPWKLPSEAELATNEYEDQAYEKKSPKGKAAERSNEMVFSGAASTIGPRERIQSSLTRRQENDPMGSADEVVEPQRTRDYTVLPGACAMPGTEPSGAYQERLSYIDEESSADGGDQSSVSSAGDGDDMIINAVLVSNPSEREGTDTASPNPRDKTKKWIVITSSITFIVLILVGGAIGIVVALAKSGSSTQEATGLGQPAPSSAPTHLSPNSQAPQEPSISPSSYPTIKLIETFSPSQEPSWTPTAVSTLPPAHSPSSSPTIELIETFSPSQAPSWETFSPSQATSSSWTPTAVSTLSPAPFPTSSPTPDPTPPPTLLPMPVPTSRPPTPQPAPQPTPWPTPWPEPESTPWPTPRPEPESTPWPTPDFTPWPTPQTEPQPTPPTPESPHPTPLSTSLRLHH